MFHVRINRLMCYSNPEFSKLYPFRGLNSDKIVSRWYSGKIELQYVIPGFNGLLIGKHLGSRFRDNRNFHMAIFQRTHFQINMATIARIGIKLTDKKLFSDCFPLADLGGDFLSHCAKIYPVIIGNAFSNPFIIKAETAFCI